MRRTSRTIEGLNSIGSSPSNSPLICVELDYWETALNQRELHRSLPIDRWPACSSSRPWLLRELPRTTFHPYNSCVCTSHLIDDRRAALVNILDWTNRSNRRARGDRYRSLCWRRSTESKRWLEGLSNILHSDLNPTDHRGTRHLHLTSRVLMPRNRHLFLSRNLRKHLFRLRRRRILSFSSLSIEDSKQDVQRCSVLTVVWRYAAAPPMTKGKRLQEEELRAYAKEQPRRETARLSPLDVDRTHRPCANLGFYPKKTLMNPLINRLRDILTPWKSSSASWSTTRSTPSMTDCNCSCSISWCLMTNPSWKNCSNSFSVNGPGVYAGCHAAIWSAKGE